MPSPPPSWHALLAPFPTTATPRLRRLGPESPAPDDPASAIAGWSELVLDLSAGPAGARVIHVVLDPHNRPLAASDLVYFRPQPANNPDSYHQQQSIGGRFEEDGSFRGTCWIGTATGPADADDLHWTLTPSEPREEQVTALRSLVASVLALERRA
jgi:hypothetical protein